MGNFKYPGLLLIFLVPALISGASAAIYTEAVDALIELDLNSAPVGLDSSLDSIQPRIFTEHVDSLLGVNLNTSPAALDSSLNAIRPRIFTENLDSILKNNLYDTPSELDSSQNAVRPRIFTEHLDTILKNDLSDTPNALDSSLAQIRPRIFTDHLDTILKNDLSDTPNALDNSLAQIRPRIFTEHLDSILKNNFLQKLRRVAYIPVRFGNIGYTPQEISVLKKRASYVSNYYNQQSYGKEILEWVFAFDNWEDTPKLDDYSSYISDKGKLISDLKKEMANRNPQFKLYEYDTRVLIAATNENIHSFTTGDYYLSVVSEKSRYGSWAHEVGHSLFKFPDRSSNEPKGGIIDEWGMMGRGGGTNDEDINPPTTIDPLDKIREDARWINEKEQELSYGEHQINLINDKGVYFFKPTPNIRGINFAIEGRSPPDDVFQDDLPADMSQTYNLEKTKGIMLYYYNSLENPQRLFYIAHYRLFGKNFPIWKVTLVPGDWFWGDTYRDDRSQVQFHVTENNNQLYLDITHPKITSETVVSLSSAKWDSSIVYGLPNNTSTNPDVDLKVFDYDGKMVGMNYSSDEYEVGIAGANTSGNIPGGGPEWIAYPNNINSYYIIDSTPLRKWASENNITVSNISAELQGIQYDENGTRIEYQPLAINVSLENSTVVELPALLPPAISNVSVSKQFDSALIRWDTNKEAESLIKYGISSADYIFSSFDATLTTKHSLKLEGLTPNTQYYFVVNSTDIQGNSNQSIEYSFRTLDIEPPASIDNLSASEIGTTWLNFTWTNPPDPDFSNVILYLNGTFITNISAPQNFYNVTGLSPDTEYEFGTHTVDTSGNINSTWVNHTARTAPLSDTLPPSVTNATANQSDIPDDTDHIPLWGETAQLNVTVTDSSAIASVAINLSEIGGEAAKPMVNTGGNIYSTTTNAPAGTPPKLYNLTVNATDIFGNSNTGVKIQMRVVRNGDTTGDGAVNIGDALRLANNVSYPGNPRYVLSSIYAADLTGDGTINIGDALRLANNVSYPGNPRYILK